MFEIHNEDCIVGMRERLAPGSVRCLVTSIPFGALFSYSHKAADVGNCRDGINFTETQFGLHMRFWFEQVVRVMAPGSVACIHVQQLNATQVQHGHMGLRDFRGAVIDMARRHGLKPHGEVAIPKNPQAVAQRRKLHSLLFVTAKRDSRALAPAMNDYVLFFRVPGEGEPVRGMRDKRTNPDGQFSQEEWIAWARGVWEDGWRDESAMLALDGYAEALAEYLAQEWRHAPVWGDILETDVLEGWRHARASHQEKHVCLARGSLVLTREHGYIPIQDVAVGNLVLTHRGRWRPVLAVQNTGVRPVVALRAHGVPGLVLTPSHKLWLRKASGARAREQAGRAEPAWTPASHARGGYVNLKLPEVDARVADDVALWWTVGRWLADGHWGKRGDLHISCGRAGASDLVQRLGAYAGMVRVVRTGAQVRLRDRAGRLREIVRRCGRGAQLKRLPPEALSLDDNLARALLDGYLAGDGHLVPGRRRWMATSVSRGLLLGVSMLVQRVYGALASLAAGRPPRIAKIEGRTVACQQEWVLSFDLPGGRRKRPFLAADGSWRKVRSVEPAGEIETWNLRVEEDESFTAEGCIVKNCPLQLEVIRRCLLLYSQPGDLVLDPFMGIGSTAVVAIELDRPVVGFELKESYHRAAVANASRAEAARGATRTDGDGVGAGPMKGGA